MKNDDIVKVFTDSVGRTNSICSLVKSMEPSSLNPELRLRVLGIIEFRFKDTNPHDITFAMYQDYFSAVWVLGGLTYWERKKCACAHIADRVISGEVLQEKDVEPAQLRNCFSDLVELAKTAINYPVSVH
ncbi:hypothetical protein H6781_00555 [Candidatus Nomurabacteria bacterium]|nr:hypothetical protein [Candidatus Kaiserbacteria bacterium]MCB9810073.1 hypothetical protein [Candidatus Nomurabacteria bacterium]